MKFAASGAHKDGQMTSAYLQLAKVRFCGTDEMKKLDEMVL